MRDSVGTKMMRRERTHSGLRSVRMAPGRHQMGAEVSPRRLPLDVSAARSGRKERPSLACAAFSTEDKGGTALANPYD